VATAAFGRVDDRHRLRHRLRRRGNVSHPAPALRAALLGKAFLQRACGASVALTGGFFRLGLAETITGRALCLAEPVSLCFNPAEVDLKPTTEESACAHATPDHQTLYPTAAPEPGAAPTPDRTAERRAALQADPRFRPGRVWQDDDVERVGCRLQVACRPHSCPWQTDKAFVEELIDLRKAYPCWGPRKLLDLMRRRDPERRLPAVSTVARILSSSFGFLIFLDQKGIG